MLQIPSRWFACAASVLSVLLCFNSHSYGQATRLTGGDFELLPQQFDLPDGAASFGSTVFVPDVKGKQLWALQTNQNSSQGMSWRKIRTATAGYSGTFFQLGRLYLAENAAQRILVMNVGEAPKVLHHFEDGARPNDLTVDASGRVYVTLTKEGEVRRISADGKEVEVIATGIVSPNGIALSPDESRLYVSEVRPGNVVMLDLTGSQWPVEPTMFYQDEKLTKADGMCTDRAGNLYCTGEDAVWIFNPAGELLEQIKTPERPINCCFGGQHGLDLYISTFGGVLRQPMKSYGIQPNPPTSSERQPKAKPNTALTGVEARLNQVYYREGTRKLLCDILAPSGGTAAGQALPCIVLVHGGGWLHGDKTKFRALALRLVEKGYVVVSVEYRLGHEAKFPAGVRDCNAAVAFVRHNAVDLGIDPNRVAAVGGSAGGHLVGLMGSGFKEKQLRPTGVLYSLADGANSKAAAGTEFGTGALAKISTRPDSVVVMAGPLEMVTGSVADRSHAGQVSNATQWLGDSIDGSPAAYQLGDAFSKIAEDSPPMLFLTGSLDNPSRNNRSLAALHAAGVAQSAKVVHQGAKHGHWNRLDWMPQVVEDIHAYLAETLAE